MSETLCVFVYVCMGPCVFSTCACVSVCLSVCVRKHMCVRGPGVRGWRSEPVFPLSGSPSQPSQASRHRVALQLDWEDHLWKTPDAGAETNPCPMFEFLHEMSFWGAAPAGTWKVRRDLRRVLRKAPAVPLVQPNSSGYSYRNCLSVCSCEVFRRRESVAYIDFRTNYCSNSDHNRGHDCWKQGQHVGDFLIKPKKGTYIETEPLQLQENWRTFVLWNLKGVLPYKYIFFSSMESVKK